MALRAVKPKEIKSRLKVFFYGAAGVGKTMAAIQFPAPYIIDTEGSTDKPQYVKAIEKSGGAVFNTIDFDEMIKEVKSLLTEKHNYKTLVIDSLTLLYNDLLDKAEKKVGSEFGRHYGEANKRMKQLLNLLFRIDMNVIITSHSKNEYGQNLSVLGQTFDCYKKLDYLFDLTIEVQKRGDKRYGFVKKTRLEGFPDGDTFPFSYDEIANRYGRDVIEREAVAEKLASKEQVDRLTHLVEVFREPQDVIEKWLDKANAETFADMSETVINKLINHMESKSSKLGAVA